MANKTNIDSGALNVVYLTGRTYIQTASQQLDNMEAAVNRIKGNEALEGAAGEEFLSAFDTLASKVYKLKDSIGKVSNVVDGALARYCNANNSSTADDAKDKATNTAQDMGIYAKE